MGRVPEGKKRSKLRGLKKVGKCKIMHLFQGQDVCGDSSRRPQATKSNGGWVNNKDTQQGRLESCRRERLRK